jgi:hypothetical protein
LIPGAQVDSAEAAPVVFSFFENNSPDGQLLFTARENGLDVFSSADVEVAARALESQAHQFVAANARNHVFVHAGVVSWHGKAILIPGTSHSGKSTLVMALVKAGATYYSDEYAVLDLEGRVHAFPRSPRLRPDVLNEHPESLSITPVNGASLCSLPVGLVLKTRYNPAGTWQPQVLTPGEALLALLENTVAVRSQSELSVKTLKCAVTSAIGLQSERADAASAARHILQLLNESWLVSTAVTTKLAIKDTL